MPLRQMLTGISAHHQFLQLEHKLWIRLSNIIVWWVGEEEPAQSSMLLPPASTEGISSNFIISPVGKIDLVRFMSLPARHILMVSAPPQSTIYRRHLHLKEEQNLLLDFLQLMTVAGGAFFPSEAPLALNNMIYPQVTPNVMASPKKPSPCPLG